MGTDPKTFQESTDYLVFAQTQVLYRAVSKLRGSFIYGSLNKMKTRKDSTPGSTTDEIIAFFIVEHGKANFKNINDIVNSPKHLDAFICRMEEVWPETLHVFTGKQDKYKNNIFCGDKLAFSDSHKTNILYTVYFNESTLTFEAISESGKYTMAPKLWEEGEVVSNVLTGTHFFWDAKDQCFKKSSRKENNYFKCMNCGVIRLEDGLECPTCAAPWDISRRPGMPDSKSYLQTGEFAYEGEIKKK